MAGKTSGNNKRAKKKSFYKRLVYAGILTALLVFIGYKNPHYLYAPGDLSNAHKKIGECNLCHEPFGGISSLSCWNCHNRLNMRKKKPGLINFHRRVQEKDCRNCHSEHLGVQGKITKKIDHKSMKGDTCLNCHNLPKDMIHRVIFQKNDLYDPTEKQLKRNDTQTFEKLFAPKLIAAEKETLPVKKGKLLGCLICHTTEKWKPAIFEHNRFYPLLGFHRVAGCSECHTNGNGNFKSFNCFGCHVHKGKRVVALHHRIGISRIDACITCHRGGLDDHSLKFALDKKHKVGNCFLCHEKTKGNYKVYTCYGCHDHREDKIKNSHIKLGIPDYENCLLCHRGLGVKAFHNSQTSEFKQRKGGTRK